MIFNRSRHTFKILCNFLRWSEVEMQIFCLSHFAGWRRPATTSFGERGSKLQLQLHSMYI